MRDRDDRLNPSCRRTLRRLWLGLLVVLCVGACERPFVEEAPPRIEVLEPDPNAVLLDESVPIRVRVTSFRTIDRVTIDGRPLRSLGDDVWADTLRLRRGVTGHVLRAYDAEGLESRDTLRLAHLLFGVAPGPPLPLGGRGGHTATPLPDGRLLVTGGTPALDEPALASAFLFDPVLGATSLLPSLVAARTGHTATLLPDGRVLIVGGSRTDSVRTQADLVETAEVFDPATTRFRAVPVVGTPIRRTAHAAVARTAAGEAVVDLYSGWTASPDGRLFVRSDVRSLVLRGDTLYARNSLFALDDAAPGLTATPLPADPGTTRVLLAGSYFARGVSSTATYTVTYAPNGAIGVDAAGPLHRPRNRHGAAALAVGEGLVFVVGGRGGSSGEVLAEPEVYAEVAERFFRYPPLAPAQDALLRRFGHSATFLSSGRILLAGGYTPTGNGKSGTAYITFFD